MRFSQNSRSGESRLAFEERASDGLKAILDVAFLHHELINHKAIQRPMLSSIPRKIQALSIICIGKIALLESQDISVRRVRQIETSAKLNHGANYSGLVPASRPGPGAFGRVFPEIDASPKPVIRVLTGLPVADLGLAGEKIVCKSRVASMVSKDDTSESMQIQASEYEQSVYPPGLSINP
jgi:hypothetical protein